MGCFHRMLTRHFRVKSKHVSRVYRALDAIFLRSDKLYEERVPRITHSKDKTAGHAAEHPRTVSIQKS